MSKIRVGVIGAGHLGKIHTRLLCGQETVEVVGVADPSPLAQKQVVDEFNLPTCSDYQKLVDQIDAAVVATPTRLHFDVANELLNSGIHVLIEKTAY